MPIAAVVPPINKIVIAKMVRRPSLSPRWPNSTAPNGRATKATPNTASADSSEVVGLLLGKNALPKMVAR
jgi:hypothetical protein